MPTTTPGRRTTADLNRERAAALLAAVTAFYHPPRHSYVLTPRGMAALDRTTR